MESNPDHYQVLGVSADSDDVVIQAAYKALMRKYHPDTNSDSKATARAQALNAAFAVLGNPGKRAAYDALRAANDSGPSSPPQEEPTPTAPDSATIPEGLRWKPNALGMVALGFALILILVSILDKASVPSSLPADTGQAMANSPPYGVKPTLPVAMPSPVNASLPMPAIAVAFDDLEAAAGKFDSVLNKFGLRGARAFSEGCHKQLAVNPTWSIADRCTAFDIAAAHIDAGVSGASNGVIYPNIYFRFKDENAGDTYTQLGVDAFTAQQRIINIRHSVVSIADQIITSRLNREQAARSAMAAGSVSSAGVDGTATQTIGLGAISGAAPAQ